MEYSPGVAEGQNSTGWQMDNVLMLQVPFLLQQSGMMQLKGGLKSSSKGRGMDNGAWQMERAHAAGAAPLTT